MLLLDRFVVVFAQSVSDLLHGDEMDESVAQVSDGVREILRRHGCEIEFAELGSDVRLQIEVGLERLVLYVYEFNLHFIRFGETLDLRVVHVVEDACG